MGWLPPSSRTRQRRDFLADHDAPCPSCDYNLRGVRGDRCPECGRRIELDDVRARLRPLAWTVRIFDLDGLFALVGINVVLVALFAWLHVGRGSTSWFTSVLFRLGRGPTTPFEILLWTLAVLFGLWGLAWQGSTRESYFWQRLCAVIALLLTLVHAVAVLSLL